MQNRERLNDGLRSLIDHFIGACAVVFHFILFLRKKTFQLSQEWLRRKYGIREATTVHVYDEFMRALIEKRFRELGTCAMYAYTSGSTTTPKKIAYDRKRLRKTRMVFIQAIFQYLSQLSVHRTLFIFSTIGSDGSLTSLLLQESGLPPYFSGLQAPHRVQNHPLLRHMAQVYGETAVRLWILTISNPGLVYATNPSTIATFLSEINENWNVSRRMISDYVNSPEKFSDLRDIHKRIASAGSTCRLQGIANTLEPLPVANLFPSLRGVCCWDSGYVSPFLDQIRTYLPECEYKYFPMYSMSTETIETIPGSVDGRSFLPLAPGVYYEFIEEGQDDLPANLLRPWELIPGRSYSMVVSDAFGLRRYQTEDLFQCREVLSGIPDLRFSRRRNLSYSFTGEKLTGDQLKLAYQEAESSFPELRFHGFLTCFPSKGSSGVLPHYRLIFVKTSGTAFPHGSAVASLVEQKLISFNHEFRSKIETRRLGRIAFESVPVRDFVLRLSDAKVCGSQFKFLPLYPKLWEAFTHD